ncbi:MAG: tRNA guanosine(34) transglycosylase Tgt [Candidatus Parcubacteria bacterium]|nr:tRNA guanosine(34) transglycosylase Tgt [Candidatus Parcubacteria bacterium]
MYKLLKQSKRSNARLGILKTAWGVIHSPFFMPIATKAAIKNLSVEDMEQLGAEIILSNTYHLYLQPGEKLIKKAGGLHKFMNWPKPILTDSGGYQVFSLSKMRKIKPDGVEFQSHLDGSKHFLTPEKSIQIQQDLGVDIMMALDICPPGDSKKEEVAEAVVTTYDWAQKCIKQWHRKKNSQLLFGIIQGGIYPDLRRVSIQQLTSLNFSGYALGGLAVGEDRKDMFKILEKIVPLMPDKKPRYLMGVGRPEEIVHAVRQGIDMFDCVIPTREARHGRLYQFCTQSQKGAIKLFGKLAYKTVIIKNTGFKKDFSAINSKSKIKLLRSQSKSYLHHLFKTDEGLGLRLATLNNLEFYLSLLTQIRRDIKEGRL